MSTPIAKKYLACTEFDSGTGECVASVWVDPPGVIPTLTAAEGLAFATMIGIVWIAVAAFHPIQDAVRDN